MLKRLLYITAIFFSCFTSYSQNYGNEWIDYSQKYYKFPVSTTGLYKIDYNFLTSNSIPITGISSSQFQIFGHDKEIPLYMVDNGDNSFDPGDYFLFVADKNDGWLDSVLFYDPSKIANPGYSLISDTNYYYFSWKNSGNGLRYQTEPDQNFSTYTPATNVIVKSEIAFGSIYVEGKVEDHASGSIYANGEGYGYSEVAATSSNSQTSVNFSTPQVYTGIDGQKPKVHCRVTSNSNATVLGSLSNNHHLRLNFGNANLLFKDTIFTGYQQIISNAEFQTTDLSNGTTPLFYEAVANIDGSVDRLVLTYATLNYARNPHASFSTFDRFMVRNQSGESKIRVDLSALGGNPIVFGFGSQNTAVLPINSSGVWQFNLPENTSGSETDVRIFDQSNPLIPILIVAVDSDAQFTDFTSVNIDSALIFVYPNAFKSAAENYKDYRESLQGGGYNVIMISSEEIYHHFGGGVQNGPAGIRRFVDYIYDQSIQKPVGLFLLGKGVSPYYFRQDPSALPNNFVPTFGYPSSDNAILSYLNGSKWDPLIPVGRISIRTNAELENYLSKVQEYEALQNQSISSYVETKDWQKQILHFVGGSDAIQQTNFQGFMNSMKSIAEDTLFAGNVTSYFKTSSAPLDPNVVAGVTEQIENGVSIMNFFGHASTTNNGFEINVDEPLNWNNAGKYPIVIGNSCYNGDLYLPSFGVTSERFVNLPQEGAIAFISSVGVGYDVPLYIYSSELYRQFSYKNYGGTFGHQIKKTIEYLQSIYSISSGPGFNLMYEAMCSQMVLNGDPLLRVNYNTNPEIHITNSDLSLSPANVNLNTDSLYLTIKIKNLGKSVNQPLQVEIKRDFPGTNIDSVYTVTLDSLNYEYTLIKSFPLQAQIAAGINTFTVSVDIPSFIDEQFEEYTNNTATANFFLNIDGINPIWPYNYAVVPYDTITVKASTINPLAELRTYVFQIDTTDTYDSPQFRTFTLSELGGVKEVRYNEWLNNSGLSFPLICADSEVYFWRVAVDSSVLNWSEFSFQYIKDHWGWGQDHFFQFKNNDFAGMEYNRTDRLREFPISQLNVITINAYDSYTTSNDWQINGEQQDYATCGTLPAIYVGVVDPITLQAWKTHCPGGAAPNNDPSMDFGNYNNNCGCRNRYEKYFVFDQSDATQLANLENMLTSGIPDSNYVVVYAPVAAYYSYWDSLYPTLFTTFQNLGATNIVDTLSDAPMAVFFKKGTSSQTQTKIWPTDIAIVNGPQLFLKADVYRPNYIGIETSPIIGPSFNWEAVYWRRDSLENPATDSVRLQIKQFDTNLQYVSTLDTIFTPNDSILNLNSLIDATVYPYIQIGVYNSDVTYLTPGQVDRLHVLYSPVPEAAIDGSNGYYFSLLTDTIFEGQNGSFAFDIKNVSEFPMDSLLVSYWIEGDDHIKHFISYPRQDSLRVGQTFRDTIEFSSLNLAGYNVIWTEVNPYINGTLMTDQLEQYHFNNICQIPLYVIGDDQHPILDVTFNGEHILNRDIVNPASDILITLKDDNPFLVMDNITDTTLFGIYLTDPNGVQKRIPFIDANGNSVLEWIPANASNKKFIIRYPAYFELDGIYELSVQGSDRSNNLSGDFAYKIEFEVVHESTITQMMNYPNPFSTSTRFVFTLTGSEVPDDIRIQILTVSGKIVKTINEEEIGEIKIGRNITEFAWDGRDDFGDQLANGVYLYKVETKINGSDIKLRESGADLYFHKEFGKMYLMR